MNRRRFLQLSTLSATALALQGCVLAESRRQCRVGHRPSANFALRRDQPLRVACIGVGGRGLDSMKEMMAQAALGPEPELISICVICDVDSGMLDAASAEFPEAQRMRDYRELFSAVRSGRLEVDAVMVSTPDHTHYLATALALACGIPVYCEKPLTHTTAQARRLRSAARIAGVPTQMGTQIHAGGNYRSVVELVQSGAIGPITSCDCWVGKSWCCGKLTPGALAPASLDWDLWQGQVPAAPYIDGVAPGNWRKYWNYGSGTLGDMGCHILDLPFWALGLAHIDGLTARIHGTGSAIDAVGCPDAMEVSWALSPLAPASVCDARDPVILRWFDGGRISPTVQELGAKDKANYHDRFNVLFQGSRGFLLANYSEYLILPHALAGGIKQPKPTLSRPLGHHREWIDAVRNWCAGSEFINPGSEFDYASRLTELVLSGMVASRAGGSIEYDFATGKVAGECAAAALHFLDDPVRGGWACA